MTETAPPTAPPTPTAPTETETKPTETVDFWKQKAREQETRAKANADKAKEFDALQAANASELERAVKKARDEGFGEAQIAANGRLLVAEARALAAEAKFRNPTLAVKAVDLSSVKVSDDGTVDAAAVRSLLADLAKAEPYLVDDGKVAKPKPDDAQGRPTGTPSRSEQGLEQARKRGFITTK